MIVGILRDGGSSPRMRGALGTDHPSFLTDGIIPADAGSTPLGQAGGLPCRDHPRGCGEHVSPVCRSLRHGGSSPRMRGAPADNARQDVSEGIIPADAGSTRTCSGPSRLIRDHPRGCGEHLPSGRTRAMMRGSSLRMRGALGQTAGPPKGYGIIPADAGSTLLRNLRLSGNTDHPRGCGEHNSNRISSIHFSGSSPRMRGARILINKGWPRLRIIPADAGSTHGSARGWC